MDRTTSQVRKVDVRYVLGGCDKDVDVHYVQATPDIDADKQSGRRRRRTQRTAPPQPSNDDKQQDSPSKGKKRPLSNPENNENTLNTASKSTSQRSRPGALCKNFVSKASKVKRQLLDFNRKGQPTDKPIQDKNPKQKPMTKKHKSERKDSSRIAAVTTPDVPKTVVLRNAGSSQSPMSSLGSPVGRIARRNKAYMLSETERKGVRSSIFSPSLKRKEDNMADEEGSTQESCSLAQLARSPAIQNLSSVSICDKESPEDPAPEDMPTSQSNRLKECDAKISVNECQKKESENTEKVSHPLRDQPDHPFVPNATLESEHLKAMKSASRFIENVCDKGNIPSAQEESKEEDNRAPDEAEVDSSHVAEFFRCLHELLEQSGGDCLDEENLVVEINHFAEDSQHFADSEVQQLLGHLCQENRIMRSDGQIYII